MLTLAACAAGEPRPIAYDESSCAYCHMAIADRRFGTELVTAKGKVHEFDSIECLASYYLRHREDVRTAWVTDFARPGRLVRADSADYVGGGEARSPMALGLAAFASRADAARATGAGGEVLSWTDVLALVAHRGDDAHTAFHEQRGGSNAPR